MSFVFLGDAKTIPDRLCHGGKAATLLWLRQNGYAVPDGFIVSVEYFKKCCFGNNIISQSLKDDLERAYDELDTSLVAVRSSAPAEDSQDKSFAGQYESILAVPRQEIFQAIETCWNSASSDRVKQYAGSVSEIAVLVQEMVDARVSGVSFSAHPVTKDVSQVVIEAVTGSNEKLVQGQVTPDTYVLNERCECVEEYVALQETAVSINNAGGMKELTINESTNKLSQSEMVEVAKLTRELADVFGYPVDIEWAYSDDTLYILQCRPITTM